MRYSIVEKKKIEPFNLVTWPQEKRGEKRMFFGGQDREKDREREREENHKDSRKRK